MQTLRHVFTVLAAVCFVAGCADTADEQPAPTDTAAAPEPAAPAESDPVKPVQIAWFEGDVEAAFAEAERSGRPLFLYWGAEWCPPCHLVKSTVFRSRDFIERSTRFVPVYLDGDTPNAQAWGEKFDVLGYPTMILFTATGEEITRIPGGSDVQAYANVLDLSLASDRTVSRLLAEVLDTPRAATAEECELLAMYSWDQDTTILSGREELSVFERLHAACPESATVARSQLFLRHLVDATQAAADDPDAAAMSQAERDAAVTRLAALLADPAQVRANLYTVMFGGAGLVTALTEAGTPARARLVEAFADAYARIAADDRIYRGERLYAHLGQTRLERLDEPERPVSEALAARIRAAVAEADAAVQDVYTRQSVMNTANNVLVEAGLLEDARRLLNKEIGISKQPYYFMTALADVEQELGNLADAIGWHKRAYEVAQGPATRFQWGYYYVAGLIDMVPEETALIRDTVVAVFGELGEARGFYQRPKRQMQRLEAMLREWNEDGARDDAVAAIRDGVRAVCATMPPAEAARETCEGFLAT